MKRSLPWLVEENDHTDRNKILSKEVDICVFH